MGSWTGIQGEASALGKVRWSGSAPAGEEGNFRDLPCRGNNSWAFLIWKGLHLNLAENWDRGAASLLASGAAEQERPSQAGLSLVVTVRGINSHL